LQSRPECTILGKKEVYMQEYVTATEARDILGVSHKRVTEMLKDGRLAWIPDPLNQRAKLIRRADVDALLASFPRQPKRRAKRVLQKSAA
jgi:hypothetical protein